MSGEAYSLQPTVYSWQTVLRCCNFRYFLGTVLYSVSAGLDAPRLRWGMRLFPRYSLAPGYAALVAVGYVVAGAFAVSGTPFFSAVLTWFLMVDPYVLGHALHQCMPPHPCLLIDLPDGFGVALRPGDGTLSISLLVLILGIAGLCGVIAGGRVRPTVMFLLSSLATVATAVNWLAYAVVANQEGIAGKSLYWMPLVSTFWLGTYWLATYRVVVQAMRVGEGTTGVDSSSLPE